MIKKTIINGIIKLNPIFVLGLGMCSTLAVTTSTVNAVGMGVSTLVVLICSNIVISILRKTIPNKIRIASYIVIIASFVTVIQMLLKAYFPELSKSLGIYIPLIVVNCLILGRAEAFASRNGVLISALDGISMGVGYTAALFILGSVREIIGAGSFWGISLFGNSFVPITIAILPSGAFITLGLVLMTINIISARIKGGKTNA